MSPRWRQAGSLTVHKMLGELSYEGLFQPVQDEPAGSAPTGEYRPWTLELPAGVRYRFRARRGAFDSWTVEPGSATRQVGADEPQPAWDPRALVIDAATPLGLAGLRLADVLGELTATVTNEAVRLDRAPTAAQLCALDYDRAEGHLTGHPRLVLNKGRVGFSSADRRRYAPESGGGFALRWFGVRRAHAAFRSVDGLDERRLLAEELDERDRAVFRDRLGQAGPPDDFVLVPVHPWQAEEIVGTLYAAELSAGEVVDLGEGGDLFVPHQTVRTLANVSHPTRRDVKTAVSVRNTLVYRGLANAATLAAPAVTTWLRQISAADPLLSDRYRFDLLGEVASVSVRHPVLDSLSGLPYRFHETLGALWREPVRTRLAPGERAISFAALPYRGRDGEAVVTRLVRDSGMSVVDWLGAVLDLVLTPLLHWLLRYGVGFCPHGQNLILIVDRAGTPLRVAIKDFAQGVDLLDEDLPEYDRLAREATVDMLRWPPHLLAQSLFSSVFAGQLRFLAEILFDDFAGLSRGQVWSVVRTIVAAYRDQHPDISARFDACRLFAGDVERVCLNREHLAGQGFDKVDRDDEFDVRFGRAPNPLAGPDPDGAW